MPAHRSAGFSLLSKCTCLSSVQRSRQAYLTYGHNQTFCLENVCSRVKIAPCSLQEVRVNDHARARRNRPRPCPRHPLPQSKKRQSPGAKPLPPSRLPKQLPPQNSIAVQQKKLPLPSPSPLLRPYSMSLTPTLPRSPTRTGHNAVTTADPPKRTGSVPKVSFCRASKKR